MTVIHHPGIYKDVYLVDYYHNMESLKTQLLWSHLNSWIPNFVVAGKDVFPWTRKTNVDI